MFKKKTHEEYIAEVGLKNPNIEVIGQYIGANIKIKHRCKICGFEWDIRPAHVLNGIECKQCIVHRRKKTYEHYKFEVALINPNIEVIEEYQNSFTKIKHRCKKCGNEWLATPHNILKGRGCPECCFRLHPPKTKQEHIDILKTLSPHIELVGDYVSARKKTLYRCLECGNEWLAFPTNMLLGYGCPECAASSGEQRIKQWLFDFGFKYEFQKRFKDCKDKKQLPFDFYLPDYNCCIEYDGRQHFQAIKYWGGEEAFQLTQFHDQIKNNYCKENNIRLIRIKYDEDVSRVLSNAFGLVMMNKTL